MVWTDQIRQVKIALVAVAVVIAAASLIASHILVSDLKVEEQNKMAIWAEAMRSLNTADETTDLNLVLRVLDGNNTIPVIVTDEKGNVQTMRNVTVSYNDDADSIAKVTRLAEMWMGEGHVVRIKLDSKSYINVCYDESLMIKRLATYPYIQLGVVIPFAIVADFLYCVAINQHGGEQVSRNQQGRGGTNFFPCFSFFGCLMFLNKV